MTSILAIVAVPLAVAQPAGVPSAIADYWSWTRFNIDRFTDNTTGAHPQPKDGYINLDPGDFVGPDGVATVPFPEGTIVVKERNDADELLVDRLYLMQKLDGAWLYSFYNRQADGSFTGRDFGAAPNLCSDCHQAAPTDFVFVQYEHRSFVAASAGRGHPGQAASAVPGGRLRPGRHRHFGRDARRYWQGRH